MPIGRKKNSPNLGSQSLTAGSYRPILLYAALRPSQKIRVVKSAFVWPEKPFRAVSDVHTPRFERVAYFPIRT